MDIQQFPHKDIVIELTFLNKFLAWSFEYKGKLYGARVELKSKKVLDIASVTASLVLNAIATYEDLRLSK